MFGLWRYILALMVLISHLWPDLSRWSAVYAVFGFYMLSGYLMTFVLHNIYGFSFNGLGRFLTNRVLRIYPPYLIVMLLSLFIVLFIPDIAKNVNKALQVPTYVSGWSHNIFIFGLSYNEEARLIPPGWSLYVELFYYLFMALFLVRWKSMVFLWFLTSLGYTIYMVIEGYDFDLRYYPLEAASLPFSAGAMIFLLKDRLSTVMGWHIIPSATLFITNTVLSKMLWDGPYLHGFYMSILSSAYLLICLSNIKVSQVPGWLVKVDKFLGDLSYPVFLCHWHIATLIVWLGFSGIKPAGSYLFFSSFLFINLAAYLIHAFIERRINKIRGSIKPRNT